MHCLWQLRNEFEELTDDHQQLADNHQQLTVLKVQLEQQHQTEQAHLLQQEVHAAVHIVLLVLTTYTHTWLDLYCIVNRTHAATLFTAHTARLSQTVLALRTAFTLIDCSPHSPSLTVLPQINKAQMEQLVSDVALLEHHHQHNPQRSQTAGEDKAQSDQLTLLRDELDQAHQQHRADQNQLTKLTVEKAQLENAQQQTNTVQLGKDQVQQHQIEMEWMDERMDELLETVAAQTEQLAEREKQAEQFEGVQAEMDADHRAVKQGLNKQLNELASSRIRAQQQLEHMQVQVEKAHRRSAQLEGQLELQLKDRAGERAEGEDEGEAMRLSLRLRLGLRQ